MSRIHVHPAGTHFVRGHGGPPFFYLADTCWSAFTHPEMNEWEHYLNVRSRQGFTALQINILPQYDASGPGNGGTAFGTRADGGLEFTQINRDYFEAAEAKVAKAVEYGFVPALVLLWSDFVPGTWLSNMKDDHIMPYSAIADYVAYASERFRAYNPVYLVSGDTGDMDLRRDDSWGHYSCALDTLKRVDPESLATLHIWGPPTQQYDMPRHVLDDPRLDFFMYQSGHGETWRKNPTCLPAYLTTDTRRTPIVNGEPCYEGIGGGTVRHDARSVRRAAWLSILSGASAGLTYGAHGVWNWHRADARFSDWGSNAFGPPFVWNDALLFPGSWDYSFVRRIVEEYTLFSAEPVLDIQGPPFEIACAQNENTVVVYTSNACRFRIPGCDDVISWRAVALDQNGRWFNPVVRHDNGHAQFEMPHTNADILYIGIRS